MPLWLRYSPDLRPTPGRIEDRASVEGSSVRDAVVFPEASVEASQLAGAVVGRRASAMGAVGSVVLGDDSDVGTQLHAESPLDS